MRDEVAEAVIHVREYDGNDSVALEHWALKLAREVEQVRRQRDAALDQQVAVLELHRRGTLPGFRDRCRHCPHAWPCPTARALGVTP